MIGCNPEKPSGTRRELFELFRYAVIGSQGGATHPMTHGNGSGGWVSTGNDAKSRRPVVGIASRAAVLGPWRQTGPQIGRISHRLLILGAGRLEGLAGQPIGVQSGNPVWRDGAALCGRAFRLLEDFATMISRL